MEAADPVVDAADPVLETVAETTEPVTGAMPQLVGTVASTTESTSPVTEDLTETVMPLSDGGSSASDVVGTPVELPNILDESADTTDAIAAASLAPVDDSAPDSLLPLLEQGEAVSIISAVGMVASRPVPCERCAPRAHRLASRT